MLPRVAGVDAGQNEIAGLEPIVVAGDAYCCINGRAVCVCPAAGPVRSRARRANQTERERVSQQPKRSEISTCVSIEPRLKVRTTYAVRTFELHSTRERERRLLDVSRQSLGHWMPCFERREICVEHHRRATEHVVAQRIRERVEDRRARAADRRLTDAARADRGLRIRMFSASQRMRCGASRIVGGRFR